MNLKSIFKRLKQNNQEDSMLGKFLAWRTKKSEQKCQRCGLKDISTEFSKSLCWDCYYKGLKKNEV